MSRRKGSPTPPRSGTRWRIGFDEDGQRLTLENRGEFDELVLDDWLHVEQMDRGVWWLQLGGASFNVSVARDGRVTVMLQDGGIAHGELTGPRFTDGRPWKLGDPR